MIRRALQLTGAFVRLGRPLFLTGGFILYGLGAAVAVCFGHAIDWSRYLWGQLAVTSIQLMTHYCNDHYDYDCDRANTTPTRWSGGSRVLTAGELPPRAAFVAALVLAGLGAAAGAHVGQRDHLPLALPLVLAMLALSWIYSAPPLALHSRGLGEIDTALVVTGLVPLLGFYLAAPDLGGLRVLLLALVPLGCLQIAMILAVEFPDAHGDAAAGKRTLVVRLGPQRAAGLYAGVIALAYFGLPAAVALGLPGPVALAAAAPTPLALWRMGRARAGDCADPARFEDVAFWGVALLVATSSAELLAFVLLGRR
jgi:1,4-dihydroxy-2-naphthoate octaprenyltransferase